MNKVTFENIPQYIYPEDCERLLGKRLYKKFREFMNGSTCPIKGGVMMYYPIDVKNFFKHEKGEGYTWD